MGLEFFHRYNVPSTCCGSNTNPNADAFCLPRSNPRIEVWGKEIKKTLPKGKTYKELLAFENEKRKAKGWYLLKSPNRGNYIEKTERGLPRNRKPPLCPAQTVGHSGTGLPSSPETEN